MRSFYVKVIRLIVVSFIILLLLVQFASYSIPPIQSNPFLSVSISDKEKNTVYEGMKAYEQ